MKKSFIFDWIYIVLRLMGAAYSLIAAPFIVISSLALIAVAPAEAIGGLIGCAISVGFGLLALFAGIGLIKKTKRGYKLNKTLLIIEVSLMTVAFATGLLALAFLGFGGETAFLPALLVVIVAAAIGYGIWFAVYTYFEKRKDFFNKDTSKGIADYLSISMDEE